MAVNISLAGLNPQQLEAVRHIEGPALILAGAGSGKTRVITFRIAYLLSRNIPPAHILAVTFTNKAAEEMRKRVQSILPGQNLRDLIISTFHSFGVRILRKYINHLGYKSNFCIYTEQEKRSLIRKVVREQLSGIAGSFLESAEYQISQWKNDLLGPADLNDTHLDTEKKFFLREVYQHYQLMLQAMNAVDFDDLILLAVKLWREFPEVLEECRARFSYIMVDEFQDSNFAQYEMMRVLASGCENLFVVGDDDQSIYGWRGADVRHILNFEHDYPGAKVVFLEQNYRSTNTILEAANNVIGKNPERKEKRLWSDLGQGYRIDWIVVNDENHEADWVAQKIQKINQEFQIPFRDFAILYRSNAQSRAFELVFRKLNIPYVVFGGQNFFERKEVKDLIAYLNIIINPTDDISLLRIINCPRRGIGETTIIKLIDHSHKNHLPIFYCLRNELNQLALNASARDNLVDFFSLIEEYRYHFQHSENLSGILNRFIESIVYRKELELLYKSDEQVEARWQNVEELVNALGKSQEENPDLTLADFVDQISLGIEDGNSEPGKKQKDDRSVKLMTVHSAKGMEFPFVFMVGMEERIFPHEKSVSEDGLMEERRLCYVAITRAQRHLMLVQARQRFRYGRSQTSTPSRFFEEIPEHLIYRRIENGPI